MQARVPSPTTSAVASSSGFRERLDALFAHQSVVLCVGLDPFVVSIPKTLAGKPRPLLGFGCAIVDATAESAGAFKLQYAHYAAAAAEADLAETIRYIRSRYPEHLIILDAKRGDIGSTAKFYASEAFDRYNADAVTVNPYLGFAALKPFFERPDRGAFVLCSTTDPGSAEFLQHGDPPLWSLVAGAAQRQWKLSANVGLVAGATDPETLGLIRKQALDLPILAPGVGAQGGDLVAAVRAGRRNVLISASRSILYASSEADFARAAQQAARELRNHILTVLAAMAA